MLFISFMSACQKKENTIEYEEAEELFSKSASNLQNFLIKLENASDTAEIDSLLILLEKQTLDINFSFPAETDFKLTEQENDSLFCLMQIIQSLKEKKLKEFQDIRFEDSIQLIPAI